MTDKEEKKIKARIIKALEERRKNGMYIAPLILKDIIEVIKRA